MDCIPNQCPSAGVQLLILASMDMCGAMIWQLLQSPQIAVVEPTMPGQHTLNESMPILHQMAPNGD